jgi:preprotein translocase subunit YajC
MVNIFASLPLLQTATGASPTASLLTTLLPFAAVIAIFYFMIIRPQNKKQKDTQKMLNSLRKGDEVVTVGGEWGVITSVNESQGTVVVKVDDNCKIKYSRSAIATVKRDEKAAEAEVQEKAEKPEKSEKTEKAIEDKTEKKA